MKSPYRNTPFYNLKYNYYKRTWNIGSLLTWTVPLPEDMGY